MGVKKEKSIEKLVQEMVKDSSPIRPEPLAKEEEKELEEYEGYEGYEECNEKGMKALFEAVKNFPGKGGPKL